MNHTQKVRFLYKTILKLHRGLPQELQPLGNIYVRDEFRRHKGCNPGEANIFMNEWTVSYFATTFQKLLFYFINFFQSYAINLGKQLGLRGPKTAKKLGADLDPVLLEKMSEDQLVQLYDLMIAAKEPSGEKPDASSRTK